MNSYRCLDSCKVLRAEDILYHYNIVLTRVRKNRYQYV